MDSNIPAPGQLRSTPQLAALAVLDHAIDAATGALQAAYPELCRDDDDDFEVTSATDRKMLTAARSVIDRAEALGNSLNWYWSEVTPKKPKPSPFET